MPARLEMENLESRAKETELADSDVERELECMHTKHGNILKPEGFQRASDEESTAPQSSGEPIAKSIRALEGRRFMEEPSRAERMRLTDSDNEQDPEDFQQASEEETAAAATAAAAEHSQDDTTPELSSRELPADKMMIYAIVNESARLPSRIQRQKNCCRQRWRMSPV